MKRKVLAMLMAVALCVTCIWSVDFETKAEDMGEDISFSELMTEDALVGVVESQTWGVYLADGYSVINKISSTKIGAGGTTTAARKCKVSTTAIVERQSSTGWGRVTSWTTTVASGYSAMVSKSLTVTTGYNYRVRCLHYAGTDGSSSCTSNLYM